MQFSKNILVGLFPFLSISCIVSAEDDFSLMGLHLGDSLQKAKTTLNKKCEVLHEQRIKPVRFPLAENKETWLVCNNKEKNNVVALLADGKVVHVYGQNITKMEVNNPAEKSMMYLGYRVFNKYQLWTNEKDNTITLMNNDALHPNLFVWKNPSLENSAEGIPPVKLVGGYPRILQFGASFDDLEPVFSEACSPLEIKETKVWLNSKPKQQLQVNCFNYNYLGFPRKVEAVFGDNILELAWVLTAKQEEERVRARLEESFGKAIKANSDWEMFNRGNVYLRKDKPEALLISDKLVSFYQEQNGF